MNKRNLHEEMRKIYDECIEISIRKNHDYSSDEDPYSNFRLVETIGICSLKKGIMVRICDKISRISNLLEKECMVKDESIEDTIKDTINYLGILLSYIRENKKKDIENIENELFEEIKNMLISNGKYSEIDALKVKYNNKRKKYEILVIYKNDNYSFEIENLIKEIMENKDIDYFINLIISF